MAKKNKLEIIIDASFEKEGLLYWILGLLIVCSFLYISFWIGIFIIGIYILRFIYKKVRKKINDS